MSTDNSIGTSTGRRCDGYGPVIAAAVPSSTTPLSRISSSLSPVDYSGQEWRSFQYFHEKTRKQLCTFFPDDFWSSYVLKIANTETSIWHSLIALSSYHELFSQQDMPRHQVEDYFALNQYNASIKQILSIHQSSHSAHIQLASCILFICVETLRGQIVPVVRLVTLGYRILQAEDALDSSFGLPAAEASDRRKLFALARNFLSQVVCQIYVLINNLDPDVNAIAANIVESGHGPGPRGYRFNTTTDAHQVLNSIRLQFDQYHEGAIPLARSNLAAWTLAFDAFKRRYPDRVLAPAERRAVALLELRRLYLATELSVNLFMGPVDPMLWDAHRDAFLKMLALAEKAMEVEDGDENDSCSSEGGGGSSSSRSGSSEPDRASFDAAAAAVVVVEKKKKNPPPHFHMNPGAVVVVYGIVQKCRDADIRRRALQLLASQNRQEGIWSSRMVLGAVMRLVVIEESGLDKPPQTCADIPRENRVSTVRVVKTTPDDYTVGFKLYTGWHWEEAKTFLK